MVPIGSERKQLWFSFIEELFSEKVRRETKMPVNATHPDYDFGLPGWLRARDALAGEDDARSAEGFI